MPQTIQGTGALATTIAGVDDAYVLIQQPTAGSLPNGQTNIGAMVGSAPWGALNVAQTIGSGNDLQTAYGPATLAAFDMPTDVGILLRSGVTNVRAVRVSDGLDVAAALKVVDATGFSTAPVTVGGAFAAGVLLTVTLTPVSGPAVVVTYTTQASDANLAGIAASLASAINASAAVTGPNAFLQPATTVAAVITLKSLLAGTAQNAIAYAGTGAGVTLTAAAPFTGGTAPGTIVSLPAKYSGSYANTASYRLDPGSRSSATSPTYRLTLAFPNLASEVYDNIVAYAAIGGGYSGATFAANLTAAVLGAPALSQLRPGSASFLAVAGSSTIAPNTGLAYLPVILGTDGSAFANGATAPQLGSDTSIPKTGMYALSGQIGGGLFGLSGSTDLAGAGAAAIAFAQRENAIWVGHFPTGTSSASAIATAQLLGLGAASSWIFKDFAEFTDSVNNVTARRVPSTAFVIARAITTSPETSPANQRVAGLSGTERTGAVTNTPYSPTELYSLELAGINVITTPAPGGNYFAIRHNKNSLGPSSPQGNMAYSRMTQFIAQTLNSTLVGQFVGLAQSRQPNDPVRSKARALVADFFQRLVNGGTIDSFQALCTLQNNPPALIASGVLRIDVTVVYLGIIDKLIISVTGGQTVTITSAPSTTVAQS